MTVLSRPVLETASWFLNPRPLPGARLRLICLAHAGAGASSFHPWAQALRPAGIEVRSVQYPGRENRLGEPLVPSAREMTAALADAWPELSGGADSVLFGHSMGALLAYELNLELIRRGTPHPPRRLFLSARNPPPTPPKRPPIHHLPDEAFLREVARYYGSLPAVVLADPQLLALVTPILRADFTLVDTYAWAPAPPPRTPLTILGGTEDPWTTDAELADWARYTTGACRFRTIAGGHFFHQKQAAAVQAVILGDCSA
jgi:medium-chain acyl-[acyl-carrier-protein] hydrolase